MVILIYGLPGTGKTLFAQHLAREIGAVHVNTDMVRDKLDAKRQYDETSKQQVYNELYKQIMRELNNNKDVIVDGTFHKNIRREQVKKIAVEMDEPIYLIELKVDEDIVKKRLRKRRRYSEADFEVYKQLEQQFEPTEDHHLELWSGEKNLDEMLVRAKEFINE